MEQKYQIKILRLMNSLPLIDERNKTDYCSKIEVIYNKMSTSSNNRISGDNIKNSCFD